MRQLPIQACPHPLITEKTRTGINHARQVLHARAFAGA
jgi:hypothetical protein